MGRIYLILFTLGFIFLTPLWSKAFSVQGEFDRADSLRYSENYNASIPVYEYALTKCAPTSEEFLKYSIRLGISYFLNGESSKALDRYNLILNSPESPSNQIYRAHALNNIGLIHDNWGAFSKSIEYYQKASLLYKICDNHFMMNVTKMNIGVVYKKIGNYSLALKYLTESALTFEKNKNHAQLAEAYSSIAGVQQDFGNITKAHLFYLKSLQLRKQIKDRAGTASTMNNIGGLFLDLNMPDSAMVYLSSALELMNQTSSLNKGIVLHNIADCYVLLDDFDKAKSSFTKAITLKQELQDTNEIIISLNALASLEVKRDENNNARQHLISARKLFSDLTSPQNKLNHYQTWKEFHKNTGNMDSAVYYLELATTVKNQISDELYLKELALLQEGYESKSKDQIIDTLKISNSKKQIEVGELTEKTNTLKKNISILISGFILVVVVVFFLYYAQKQQLKRQKLEAKLHGVEMEKRRISMELHDAVGSDLKRINDTLLRYYELFDSVSSEDIQVLYTKLSAVTDQITRISRDLHHPIIDDINFVEFICDFLFDTFENTDEKLWVDINGKEKINELQVITKEHLFRSFQEITSNIKQHAKADQVTFQANSIGNYLIFEISDNGIGIDSKNQKGIGLRNINDRMSSVNGSLTIQKNNQNGTRIRLKVPSKTN